MASARGKDIDLHRNSTWTYNTLVNKVVIKVRTNSKFLDPRFILQMKRYFQYTKATIQDLIIINIHSFLCRCHVLSSLQRLFFWISVERPQRKNKILTSATEPYDASLSKSFQNLSHLPPSYELALKPDLGKCSFYLFSLQKPEKLTQLKWIAGGLLEQVIRQSISIQNQIK